MEEGTRLTSSAGRWLLDGRGVSVGASGGQESGGWLSFYFRRSRWRLVCRLLEHLWFGHATQPRKAGSVSIWVQRYTLFIRKAKKRILFLCHTEKRVMCNVAQKSRKYTERWGNTDFTDETDNIQKQRKYLDEKGTLVRVLTLSVVILLGCEHPGSLTPDTVIPCRDSFSSRRKQRYRLKTFLPGSIF